MALRREPLILSRRSLLSAVAAGIVGTAASNPSAAALRQLTLMRPATGEVARDVPFWWGGAPYEQGLAELDWVMRDVQADETHPIDLRVYYLLAIVQAQFGGRPIFVTSGYRTHATNERLRRQGIDAARNSFHLHGRAVDIQMPGVEPRSMALLGLLLGLGGVGVYPKFVHLDSGPPRHGRADHCALGSLSLAASAPSPAVRPLPPPKPTDPGNHTVVHPGDAAVSVVGTPFYLVFKSVAP